jgi:hypothetical protein
MKAKVSGVNVDGKLSWRVDFSLSVIMTGKK